MLRNTPIYSPAALNEAAQTPLHHNHTAPTPPANRCTATYPATAAPAVIRAIRELDTRLIVIDTETTGFYPSEGHQVTEIGWYCINTGDGGSFIPPHDLTNADPEALHVSRYHERIAGQPHDDGTHTSALHSLLGGDHVRTHVLGSNPGFDGEHLAALFARLGLPRRPWHHRMINVVEPIYWLDPTVPIGQPPGLREGSALARVNDSEAHEAWRDTWVAAVVWHRCEAARLLLPAPLTA
jgi:hypothetical protein